MVGRRTEGKIRDTKTHDRRDTPRTTDGTRNQSYPIQWHHCHCSIESPNFVIVKKERVQCRSNVHLTSETKYSWSESVPPSKEEVQRDLLPGDRTKVVKSRGSKPHGRNFNRHRVRPPTLVVPDRPKGLKPRRRFTQGQQPLRMEL